MTGAFIIVFGFWFSFFCSFLFVPFVPFSTLKCRALNEGALLCALLFVHPLRDALAGALPEGDAEGAVAAVTALGGQLLGGIVVAQPAPVALPRRNSK